MNRKDICDLTAIFGFLATAFQLYSISELFQASKGTLSGIEGQGSNIMLLLIQAVILLIFYASVTGMALSLRKQK